jgi:Tripartite tricarboxylate transporter family receptor
MPLIEPQSTSLSGATAGKSPSFGGKQLQFLATKVVPPRCPGLIERPRLVDATSQLSEKRLAVVKGPAGFGKTSLAVTWMQRLQQSGNAVAWLTIDTDDDEPAIFLFYLAHALQHACEGVGAAAIDLIQESFLINPRAIVSTLMNDLADIDDEVYLFLEDYHWVANPDIHEALTFFLRRAPSHCHVVLTTRTEPPLQLASLRAQNRSTTPWNTCRWGRSGGAAGSVTTGNGRFPTATRWEGSPDVPTVGDFVPGYEATTWFGVGAPKNTPAEIVEKLNKEINAILADPKIKARFADLGGTVLCGHARRLPPADRCRSLKAIRGTRVRSRNLDLFRSRMSPAADKPGR